MKLFSRSKTPPIHRQFINFKDKIFSIFKDFDLSPAVLILHRELLSSVSELPLPDSRLSTTSLNVPANEQLSDILVLHLTNKQYKNALITLRQLRFVFVKSWQQICVINVGNCLQVLLPYGHLVWVKLSEIKFVCGRGRVAIIFMICFSS